MSKKKLNWVRQPQEKDGTYRFDGHFNVTRGVDELLTRNEIHALYFYIRSLADQEDGLDYLQMFVNQQTGQKLFFIDQLNDLMKEEHPPEHNYCTLMLAQEY